MVNIFAGGPKVNEKGGEYNENNNSLENLNGDPIKLDGGGLYKEFDPNEYIKKIAPKEEKTYDPTEPIGSTNNPYDMSDTGPEDISNDSDGNKKFEKQMGDGESKLYKENSKYSPIIDRLFSSNQISENTKNELLKQNLDNKPNLNSLETITDEEKEILNKTFDKIDNKNPKQNLENLSKDIKELKQTQILKGFETKFKNGKFEDEVLNKIGESYIKFNFENNQKENIENDFSIAILETQNEILSEVKNLQTDSETYKKAIKNINSGDLKKQLDGIESLYYLAYSKEGKLAKLSLDKYKRKKLQKLQKEGIKIEEKLKNTLTSPEERKKLEARKKEIIQELVELGWKKKENGESGDIFKATKLDKASLSKETKEKSSN